jgi:O-antigen/teichoic acid export membrane protein
LLLRLSKIYMGRVDLKFIYSILTLPDGSCEDMLHTFYSRIVSSDFIRKVGETFITRICLIGIGLATSVIVARALGPEGRGLYAVAATIGAIGVQFGNLGLHASNTYYVARDRTILPALIGNTIVVSFVFGGVGILLSWIILALWPQLAPVHGLLLILSLIWVPFGLAYMLLQNLLIGIQNIRAYNKIEISTKILSVVLIGFIVFLKNVTVEEVFLAGLIALFISFLWASWRLLRIFPDLPIPSFALFKENIQYGIKAYLAAFFAFLILRVDLLMVKYILSAKEAGYYSIAVSMADMVFMLPLVIGTILFPKLSAMASNQEKWAFTRKVAVSVGWVMAVAVSIAALTSKEIVKTLFGTAFIPAVPAFLWLMPGIFMLSITSIFSSYIASQYIPLVLVILYFLIAIINMVLNWLLLPILGIVGASISSSISYLLILIGILLIARRFRSQK